MGPRVVLRRGLPEFEAELEQLGELGDRREAGPEPAVEAQVKPLQAAQAAEGASRAARREPQAGRCIEGQQLGQAPGDLAEIVVLDIRPREAQAGNPNG